MNNNEKIKELLDDFTDPYSNSKVDLLVEKLSESEIFEAEHIQEITTYLISKKGFCDLCYTYTDKDFETIDTAIDSLIEENYEDIKID